MRCESCSKFVSLEMSDPEIDNLEVDEEGRVTCSVRIVRCCADCGDELKEANLDLECEPAADLIKDHINAENETKHELSVEEDTVDGTEEGGGRYAKSYFGAEVSFTIKCTCDEKWSCEGTMSDKIAASHMEELC